MTLLQAWLEIVQPWHSVFAQRRTFVRAVRQALGSVLCLGRSTLSRIIWTTGCEQNSWSGEYFLHSRASWDPHALFEPMLREALRYCPGRLVGVAVDDTRLQKTGRSIPQAQYHRDPRTPDQVRLDDNIAWQITRIFYGGKRRRIRFKEVTGVLWQGGARKRPLRLFVIAATPYRKRKNGKLHYHHPAFLLTTMLVGSTRQLLQMYFDRWQIEVNHRDEKDTLGVGQAQMWNPVSVPKQPALVVASYSALLLAALKAFGPGRGDVYAALPKWRSSARRPSCLDLSTLLRKEAQQNPVLPESLGFHVSADQMIAAAAAQNVETPDAAESRVS